MAMMRRANKQLLFGAAALIVILTLMLLVIVAKVQHDAIGKVRRVANVSVCAGSHPPPPVAVEDRTTPTDR